MRSFWASATLDLAVFGNGLCFSGPGFIRCGPGKVIYLGQRLEACPKCGNTGTTTAKAAHAHGFIRRWLITLYEGRFVGIELWERRWLGYGCGHTWLSCPPDVLPRVKTCTLAMVIILYSALVHSGLYWFLGVPPDAASCADSRTVARWRTRALALAAETEEAIRKVVEKRNELGPENLDGGRDRAPPDSLLRRPWHDLAKVTGLWRGIQLLIGASRTLGVSCASILARARSVNGPSGKPFLL
jgi:hypothetical protein